ncbi:unnamed protein product [Closterium sp. Yama58-4]|nr:unnamed protein product [Closterium sp. Yama58-4]
MFDLSLCRHFTMNVNTCPGPCDLYFVLPTHPCNTCYPLQHIVSGSPFHVVLTLPPSHPSPPPQPSRYTPALFPPLFLRPPPSSDPHSLCSSFIAFLIHRVRSSLCRAFLYPNFLSAAECDYIVNMSRPLMERSTVVGQGGKSVVDHIRTSNGCFIDKYKDPVIKSIEERIGDWTFLPLGTLPPSMPLGTYVVTCLSRLNSHIRTSNGCFIDKYKDPVIKRIEERIGDWTFLPLGTLPPSMPLGTYVVTCLSRLNSHIRTSNGCFIDKYKDPVIKRIEERIGDWTFLPLGTLPPSMPLGTYVVTCLSRLNSHIRTSNGCFIDKYKDPVIKRIEECIGDWTFLPLGTLPPSMPLGTYVVTCLSRLNSHIRTSNGCFIDKYKDPVVKRIEERIGDWTFLPLGTLPPSMPLGTYVVTCLSRLNSHIRTSNGCFIDKYKDPVIKRIEERIGDWTFLPLVDPVIKRIEERIGDWTFLPLGTLPPSMPLGTYVVTCLSRLNSHIRTSNGCFIDKYKDPVIKRIEERIGDWTFLPLGTLPPSMPLGTYVVTCLSRLNSHIRTSNGCFIDKYKDPVIKLIEERIGDWTFLPLVSSDRTSNGCFIDKYKDPVIKGIKERIGDWTFLPLANQEAMQVLQYQYGQKYGAHWDYYDDKNAQPGGPRYATVLMYLTDVVKGGETVFPQSEADPTVKDDSWSDCGKQGIAVKPAKGSALLFFSMKPDGSFDTASLHSGCPVIEGEKWSATKWIHVDSFDPPFRDPDVCQDDDVNCGDWARAGECERNPKYMNGTGKTQYELGFCRKSCGVC